MTKDASPRALNSRLRALQKRVEALERENSALRASEAQVRGLVENSARGQLVVSPSGKLLLANRALAAMLGYRSPKAILALDNIAVLLTSDTEERFTNFDLAPAGRKKDRPRFEVQLRKKSGGHLWVEYVLTPIEWDGEQAIHASFADITGRKDLEEGLRRDHFFLDTIFERFPHLLSFIDPDGRYMRVNKVWCEFFGYRPHEVVGKHFRELEKFPEADRQSSNLQYLETAASEEGLGFFESRRTNSRGERRDFRVTRAIIRDDEENFLGQLAVGTDVTEQKKIEVELIASRAEAEAAHALLNDAIETLPYAFSLYDAEDRLVLCNRRTLEMFPRHAPILKPGTPYEEVIRLSYEKGLIEDGAEGKRSPPKERFREHRTRHEPFEQKFSDGRWFSVLHRPTSDGGTLTVRHDITERKRAEEELRASRRLFRTVLETAPVAIYVKDREGRYIVVNNEFTEYFNLTPEEVLGKKSDELGIGTAEDLKKVAAVDQAVLERGQRVFIPEGKFTYAPGDERWRQTIKTPLHDDAGQIIGIVGVRVDMTDRKWVEDELRASQQRLQTVFDTLPHVLAFKDLDGRYVRVNKAWCNLHGVSAEEAEGKTAWEIPGRPEGDTDRVREEEASLLSGNQSLVSLEQIRTGKDGRSQILQSIKAIIRDSVGRPTGIVAIALDVTEQKRAEEELQVHWRLLEAVMEAIPMWVSVKDRDLNFLFVNKHYAAGVGWTTGQFRNLPADKSPVGTPKERARFRAQERKVLKTGEPAHYTTRLRLPDGLEVYHAVHKAPLRGEDGEVSGVLGIYEDITERKNMEDRLRQVERLEAIGTLAGGIAHDFNNILFPIIGFTEIVQETLPPDSDAYANLSVVLKAANRARDIVSQILLFTRQSETQLDLISLGPLVREGVKFLRSTLPKNVTVSEQIDPDLPNVYGDATQLHRVLINLCVNARQAMPEGGLLTVALRTVQLDKFACFLGKEITGEYVRLTVSDTGAGIDNFAMGQIFDPFYTTKPVGEGTGLGLSSVLGIVDQHGGALNVVSEPEKGSTFEVYLEAVRAPRPFQQPPVSADLAGNESILFVDDEESIVELAERIFKANGYKITIQTNSVRALELFRAKPRAFDLVITDQMMPHIPGERLIEKMREIRKDIPIVLSSGFSEELTPEKLDSLQLAGFYSKPITGNELLKLVRHALGERNRGIVYR